jgi:hypothetical protein
MLVGHAPLWAVTSAMGRLQSWDSAEKWAGADGPELSQTEISRRPHRVLSKILVGQKCHLVG